MLRVKFELKACWQDDWHTVSGDMYHQARMAAGCDFSISDHQALKEHTGFTSELMDGRLTRERLSREDMKLLRMERRLEKKDRKIKALQKKLDEAAYMIMQQQQTPRDIENALSQALSNMRMIPCFSGSERTVRVKVEKPQ